MRRFFLVLPLALPIVACESLPQPSAPIVATPTTDWRRVVTTDDRERLAGWRQAFTKALELARAAGDGVLEAALAPSAVDYLSVSGDRAMGLDVRVATRHFQRALALAGSRGPARPALLSRAAEALFQEGRYRESAGMLLDAAAMRRRSRLNGKTGREGM